jgi:small subunit ribosomal protein S21
MSGPINVEVRLRDGEPVERLIRRFTKKVKKEGVMDEYRKRQHYEKPSIKKRRKKMKRKQIVQKLQREREARYKD